MKIRTNSNINLRHIRAFVAVAEVGNFTRAADKLAVSQSALTVSVRQLEDSIGLSLFNRTTRRVTLTDAGVELLPAAERLLRDFETVVTDMQAIVDVQRGRVGVGALPSICAEWLPPVVARFARDFPNISIEILSGNSHETYQRVSSKEVDFGFVGQTLADAEIRHRKVVSQPVSFVARTDHPLVQKGGQLRWADLEGVTFINAGNEDALDAAIEVQPQLSETLRDTRYRSNKAEVVAALIREGIGVTVVSPIVIPTRARKDLVALELVEPSVTRTIYLIQRRGRTLSPASEQFLELALERIKSAK